jgi:hypothetical protein
MQEAEIGGDLLVQKPERMRHPHLAEAREAQAISRRSEVAISSGGELAAAVERHHRRFGERGREEGARFVREVMLDVVPAPVPAVFCAGEPFPDVVRRAVHKLALRVHHVGEGERLPRRGPGLLGGEGARLDRQPDVAMAIFFHQLVGIERIGNVVDVGELDAARAEAVVDGVEGQLPGGEGQGPLAVLDAREALFLRCREHAAVLHQAGRRIVERRVDAERDHGACRSAAGRCSSSRAALATRSGSTRRRQSWCPAGQTLL